MRCFVAIDVPEELSKKITELQKELESNNLKLTKDFHITLKFLGEINEKELKIILESLNNIKEKSFEIEIRGVGVFPNEKYIRVIWLGCYSSKLIKLANKIRDCLKDFGKDEHFVSHVTIARVKSKPSSEIYNFISKYKDIEIGKFEAKNFKLKKSILKPEGAIYVDIQKFEFE